jgi:hypothetical protein
MHMMRSNLAVSLGAIAVLAACSGGGGTNPASPGCGSPPPSASPVLDLVYPIPNATAVSEFLGFLVFATGGVSSQEFVTLSNANTPVPVGAFTAPPSPLPSPRVTPGSKFSGDVSYVAVPVPTLSPETTYTVSYTYQDFADNPPSCMAPVTLPLGSFTTQ